MRNETRPIRFPSLAALCFGSILLLVAAPRTDRSTTVRFQLIDAVGNRTSAMVCISDAKNGTVRLPPDGQPNPPVSKIGDFTGGIEFEQRSDWVGPVRKTRGIGNNQDRSFVYEEILSLPYWGEPVMYLNLGFRLVAAAGSDVPWGSTIGEVRTYVHTGSEFDPDRWFAGLKAGRSFVSNGPALDFSIDSNLPGSELKRNSRIEPTLRTGRKSWPGSRRRGITMRG